jgi:TPR repeat protein
MSQDNDFLRGLVLLRNDPQLAARVLHEARAGNVDAQYAMGLICAEGRGVPVDLAQAFAWLTAAILQGDRDASTLRNIVGSQMTDEEYAAGKRYAAEYVDLTRAASASH